MVYAIPRHGLIVCCTEMYSIYGVDSFVSSPDFYRPAAWINENSITNTCFNAVGVAVLIAQGCQTIVRTTLG